MRSSGRRRAEAGFTLLEMIVVLVVLALALGLALSRGPSRSPALQLRAAARRVTSGLRVARARAIATDRPVAVSFDPAGHSLRIGTAAPIMLPAGVAISPAPQGRPAAIVFAPDGSSSGGRVRLAAGALRRSVAVDWLTGQVEASDDTPAR